MQSPLLSIRSLRTYFRLDEGVLKAVDGVDLDLFPGQTLGIIGESGCGKTVMARSVLRLVVPPGYIEPGSQIILNREGKESVDIASLPFDSEKLRQIRGSAIAMVFQEPMASLSPVHKVGDQIMEAALLHVTQDQAEARAITLERLTQVGIPNPERTMDAYSHELSGGLRQRIMIAMALICHPDVLIADEPTTALDVTVQWQILRLLADLREQFGMAIMYVTHDLGVVAQIADAVAVMYLGEIVETADIFTIFENALHPYARNLLKSIPQLKIGQRSRLEAIAGTVPVPINLPTGCRFADRCEAAFSACREAEPALVEVEPGHAVRCFLYHKEVETK